MLLIVKLSLFICEMMVILTEHVDIWEILLFDDLEPDNKIETGIIFAQPSLAQRLAAGQEARLALAKLILFTCCILFM